MARENNIDIIIKDNDHLDYESPESLGLKLSRKVDDFNNLSKRFGDFSYTFSVPQTKNNNIIFGSPNAVGSQKIFVGKKFPCQIYNNKKLLLNGILELVGMKGDKSYDVVVHSLLSEFIDDVGDKELKDISTFEPVVWNYEKTIVDHLNANYLSSDDTLWQFPFIFYNTVYCPTNVFTSKSDDRGIAIYPDDDYQNFYYVFNSVRKPPEQNNYFFYHQFPPAFYLVRIIEGIFATVGWQIGGSWIQRPEIKMIICPFVGESDIYDQVGANGTLPVINPALFMPKGMKMIEFLSSVFNAFNLYFIIDTDNKTVVLEDWNTMFGSQNNPLNLDRFIDEKTIVKEKPDNANPSIMFGDMKKNNENDEKQEYVCGDNKVMSGYTVNAEAINWVGVSNKQFNGLFNKLGTDDEIELKLGTPRMKTSKLWNDYSIDGTDAQYGTQNTFHPIISKQNPFENNNKKFNKKDDHTFIYNTEDTIQHAGTFSMYYYYGQSSGDTVNKAGKDPLWEWLFVHLATGVTYSLEHTKIGFCSPFMMSTYRTKIQNYLNNMTAASLDERDVLTCTYLQTIYTMFARSDNNIPTTPYSLVFDDDDTYHDSLFTVYHKNKYERYQNSNILKANLVMDENLYDALPINRPLIYKGEIYHLIDLTFDPIKKTGAITMIKDL